MNWLYLTVPGILGVLAALHPALGIALFVASIPIISYFLRSPAFDFSAVTLAALFVVLGTVLRLTRNRTFCPSWVSVGVLVFIAASFSGAAVRFSGLLPRYPNLIFRNLLTADQLNPFVFIGETSLWIVAVFLYVGVRVIVREEKQLGIIFNGLLAQGALFLAVMVWDVVRQSKPFPDSIFRLYLHNQAGSYAIFSEHNSFAVFCLIQLCLVVGGLVLLRGAARVMAAVLLVAYALLVGLALSLSTILAAILILPGGVLFVFLRSARSRLAFILLAAIGLAGLAVVYTRLRTDLGELGSILDERISVVTPDRVWASTAELRLYPWLVSVNMIKDFPILGIGPGRFYQAFPEYRPRMDPGPLWSSYSNENAHNYYLQVGAELGIVGLLLLLAFIVWTLARAAWRNPVAASAGLAFAAVAVASLLQHPLLEEPIFFCFVVVAALVPAASGARLPLSAIVHRRSAQVVVGCLTVLFGVHLADAWGKPPRRFDWGLYGIERNEKEYRWASDLALFKRESLASPLPLEFKAHNPDIRLNPLVVAMEQDGKEVARLDLHDHEWHSLEVKLETENAVVIRTSRTFQPPGESRKLGVAISGLP